MTKGIRNALLFAVGALVAAFLVAYGAGVFTRAPAPAGTASAPASPESSATSKEGRLPPGADGQKEAPEPVTVTDPTQISPPTFDVVRVEGNGSIVIAGKSVPNSRVEILAGSNVLATALSGPGGDFASVLDTPLKPGDYQLVLRSTTPANIVAMSKETAVVSIPEHPGGQVLALVEAPGEPSKLITVPEPAKPGTEADGAAPGGQPAPGAAPGSAAAPSGEDTTVKPAEEKPAEERHAEDKPETPAAPGSAGTAGGQPAAREGGGGGAVTTAPGTAASGETGRPAAAASAPVSVEAVEIEGNKVFVAGTAKAGSTVRVYANDVILGEARTSPVGRFLVEAIHELAVGDYIIRADMLSTDGTRVEARAAVPFTREPGEAVAAVAQGAEPARGGAQAPQQQPGAAGTAPSGSATAPATTEPPTPGGGAGSEGAASPGAAPSPSVPQPGSAILPPLGGKIVEEPPTIVAPKLQEVMGAVIIRRGDTLWRISRRVYGHGIRYSTIYLANQDQIADPDRIWPGQVFTVPDKSSQGEPADMSKIGGQATTITRPAE